MALIQRLPVQFVGPDVDSLPQLLPNAGVSGYVGRYLPQLLPGADGDVVASVPNLAGGTFPALIGHGAAKLRVPSGADGDRYVEVNSASDDYFIVPNLSGPFTIALVVRPDVASNVSTLLMALGGTNVSRDQFTSLNLFGDAGQVAATYRNVDGTELTGAGGYGPGMDSSWHTLLITFPAGAVAQFTLGFDSVDSDLSWAEAVIWDRQLDQPERTAVVNALASTHAALLAS